MGSDFAQNVDCPWCLTKMIEHRVGEMERIRNDAMNIDGGMGPGAQGVINFQREYLRDNLIQRYLDSVQRYHLVHTMARDERPWLDEWQALQKGDIISET